jgi:modulator of FtsH protease HflC
MSARLLGSLAVLILLFLIGLTCVFTVSETELAIRTEFGAIVASHYAPGLHWKLPWDQVSKFDRRTLTESHPNETFLTNDNVSLIVDFYIKWRVRDASLYYTATGGSEESAGSRVSDIVKGGIKNVVAARTLQQTIVSERSALTTQIYPSASQAVQQLGVTLIDVRIERIDLPEEVATRVYDTMNANFKKTAGARRAEGDSQATSIKAGADRQATEIRAQADRDALRVKGDADEAAADIYARAYSGNRDFYAFYRSLQAYKDSLGKDGDVIVLSPDSEFLKYMKDPGTPQHH